MKAEGDQSHLATCFSDGQIAAIAEQTRLAANYIRSTRPWPKLRGNLVVLFTSRTGSTYLSSQISRNFRVGNFAEDFNFPAFAATELSASDVVHSMMAHVSAVATEAGWFAVKLGISGVLTGINVGFFSEYLDNTVFVLLVRREILRQAISVHKARIKGHYLSHLDPERSVSVDDLQTDEVVELVRWIHRAVYQLLNFARLTGRPTVCLFYEDFEGADVAHSLEAIGGLGVPRRVVPSDDVRAVRRMSDEINLAWYESMLSSADPRLFTELEGYSKLIEELQSGGLIS